jgi:hypothetical protein
MAWLEHIGLTRFPPALRTRRVPLIASLSNSILLDADGRFSFTAPSKPDRFEAESATAHGELNSVSLADNVIVVR